MFQEKHNAFFNSVLSFVCHEILLCLHQRLLPFAIFKFLTETNNSKPRDLECSQIYYKHINIINKTENDKEKLEKLDANVNLSIVQRAYVNQGRLNL